MQKANVTISRGSDEKVRISIKDLASRVKFVDVELSLEDFGLLMTGRGEVEGDATYRNLEIVGKTKRREQRQVVINKSECGSYDYQYEDYIKENFKEECKAIEILRSQGTVEYIDETNYAVNYYVVWYE